MRISKTAMALAGFFVFATSAHANDASLIKPGDLVKETEAEKARREQENQAGRSATSNQPNTTSGAPTSGKEQEHNLLKGVDPSVK